MKLGQKSKTCKLVQIERFIQLLVITFVILVADIAIEIYVPALPQISYFFGTKQELIKLTISYNIVGLAVSGLFYGALSDKYGRKPILITGTSIFCIASLLCAISPNAYFLIVMRIFQGIGQGVAVVVGFASIRDLYSKEKCAQIISRLSMIVAISPAAAPIIGSMILDSFGWQSIFGLLFLLGIAAVFMLCALFTETLRTQTTKPSTSLVDLISDYSSLLKNKSYLAYSAVCILNFVWLWNVIASTPFLLMESMGVSIKTYGYLITLNVSGFILGTIINQIYVVRLGIKKMISIGIFMPLITDITTIFLHTASVLTPILLQSIWLFSALGLSFVLGNATTAALDQVNNNQNSKAMAVLVFLEMTLSAIAIYINSFFYNGTVVPISTFTIACVSISILIFLRLAYKDKKKSATSSSINLN